ncbi:hypothetical protein NDU88_007106 [Pleurodeles waltl]|uniref:Uncharacterized protein n=1 Tax=Pleurodeles waltl TaxID=8319 RepID=A0AAV7VSJ2_PLEWA|nr:hypothetical protein NDU88_007106 [Pleurodeles waltl]
MLLWAEGWGSLLDFEGFGADGSVPGRPPPKGSQREKVRLLDRISQSIKAAAYQPIAGLWCLLCSSRLFWDSVLPPAGSTPRSSAHVLAVSGGGKGGQGGILQMPGAPRFAAEGGTPPKLGPLALKATAHRLTAGLDLGFCSSWLCRGEHAPPSATVPLIPRIQPGNDWGTLGAPRHLLPRRAARRPAELFP